MVCVWSSCLSTTAWGVCNVYSSNRCLSSGYLNYTNSIQIAIKDLVLFVTLIFVMFCIHSSIKDSFKKICCIITAKFSLVCCVNAQFTVFVIIVFLKFCAFMHGISLLKRHSKSPFHWAAFHPWQHDDWDGLEQNTI